MKSLEKSVSDTINQYRLLTRTDTILVAASGGPDSTALLCILARLFPDRLKAAVYVDHQLREEETFAEKQYVRTLCASHNIDFECITVDVPGERKKRGESVEACARRLRYEALDESMIRYDTTRLAVGHTRDDQVEEVLIRLIRGSGASGLSGMKHQNEQIIRPLLDASKQEILDYLESSGIYSCTDSSNKSRAFLRNRVRLELIPLLERDFNPAIRQAILNTAAILGAEDHYLEALTNNHFSDLVIETSENDREWSLPHTRLGDLDLCLQRRIIEKLFHHSGSIPTFHAVEKVASLARDGRTGATLHFSGGMRVIKTSETLIFSSRRSDRNERFRQDYAFTDEIRINDCGTFEVAQLDMSLSIRTVLRPLSPDSNQFYMDRDKLSFPLVLRAPQQGESFLPLGAPGTKKVSRYLSDKKIPTHLRYRFPILASSDGEIIAIPRLTISERVKLSDKTTQILALSAGEIK